MDCTTFQEHISAAVDGEIDNNAKLKFDEHLHHCIDCRSNFELEQITKRIVKHNVQRVTTPAALRSMVTEQIQREASTGRAQSRGWLNISDLLTWKTAFAVSGALAVIIVLFLISSGSHHSHAHPVDGNIVHQTYNNFDSVLDGLIKPQITSDKPEVVQAFLSSKTNFNVSVPKLKRCELVGGVFSEYEKEGLAHVIYKQGSNTIYMYQANLRCVLDSRVLKISDEAKSELQKTGWYFENHAPECSMIMWVVDSTVCCAIADISRDNLLAFLTETE